MSVILSVTAQLMLSSLCAIRHGIGEATLPEYPRNEVLKGGISNLFRIVRLTTTLSPEGNLDTATRGPAWIF